ncbi:type IX secretion system protein PorD [Zunongwangia sp. HGR-M22]|uniref:type IX secretion system protein PorD n=1 Tax=Zunongwangia sp. HGR-M22 TaxID=3015168 RepID=UPI0022DE8239|nr:DUF4835 family protein [Zunongwangia sp. HGR-M22]WBL24958.1 DUF4835 family protein [Zunongwangia sp. HGR-M22]
MNRIIAILVLFSCFQLKAQELNCSIQINAEQTGQANLSVFKTLKSSLQEFVNTTSWTGRELPPEQRINCSMFITINSFEGENFSASIQVQSSRPVFGSDMVSPIFNYNDDDFNFAYREYQPLNYNQNSYSSNLVSVVSFYVYTILGLDADSFQQDGGTPFFEEAKQIVTVAQQSNSGGWQPTGNTSSRFRMNADLLSNSFKEYRNAMYTYHRQGLDRMHENLDEGKKSIAAALEGLRAMNSIRRNSLLLRMFFDAKSDEIVAVFTGGPDVGTRGLTQKLTSMAPSYARKWRQIK